MNKKDKKFLEELKKAFAQEAREHLQVIVSGLLSMEKNTDPGSWAEEVEGVHRALHSLKGAARAVNEAEIGAICQAMEAVLFQLKNKGLVLEIGGYDLLQQGADSIQELLCSPGEKKASSSLLHSLNQLARGQYSLAHQDTPTDQEPSFQKSPFVEEKTALPKGKERKETRSASFRGDTVRINTVHLDSILRQMEELISIKLVGEERLQDLQALLTLLEKYMQEEGRGQRTEMNLGDGRAISPLLLEMERRLKHLIEAQAFDYQGAHQQIKDLQAEMNALMMLPFSTLLQLLPKMVRDLSREQNKKVNLVMKGEGIQVDRRILEQIKDPLIHLIRNCIDHGLEEQGEREAQNKPQTGNITLSAHQEGKKVRLTITDDGQGIHADKVRQIALDKGLITKSQAEGLDRESSLMLIFQSGVTTSSEVTDISGYGLGMAIVQEALDGLGGSISVESKIGEGTTFQMLLPLIQASFRGILIQEWGERFIIPTLHVERVFRFPKDQIKSIENRETVLVEKKPLSLVRLGPVLGMKRRKNVGVQEHIKVIVLHGGTERMGFAVDDILYEQELFMKGLGSQLQRVPHISGASVLGSGKVVCVLHVPDLLLTAGEMQGKVPGIHTELEKKKEKKRILVVEDSITSRMLLKNILTTAGYGVETVVDGQKAWDILQEKTFDLVVSDVQMPKVDGFQLTQQIRGQKQLAQLPVVLVTSLDSQADREQGAQVGADAYVVKSNFDQGNLLQVIGQLVSPG